MIRHVQSVAGGNEYVFERTGRPCGIAVDHLVETGSGASIGGKRQPVNGLSALWHQTRERHVYFDGLIRTGVVAPEQVVIELTRICRDGLVARVRNNRESAVLLT